MPDATAARPASNAGFTLLELLLVLGILAGSAALGLAVVSDQDGQNRAEQTRRRLDLAQDAILGSAQPIYDGQARLSGFVADNGRLPDNLRELTADNALIDSNEQANGGVVQAGLLEGYKARAPLFDPRPAGTGLNDGGEIALGQLGGRRIAGEWLYKGLRKVLAFNGVAFRDGWGNHGGNDDASNYGWLLSPREPWRLTSLGANNQIDAAPPANDANFVADSSLSIAGEQWRIGLTGWQIRVSNSSGVDFPQIAGQKLRASILVYVNQPGGGRWYRATSNAVDCLDGDQDGRVGALPCPATALLTFDNLIYPGAAAGSSAAEVPQGRHLLLLVLDGDGQPHTADDAPYTLGAGAQEHRISAQVSFYAGRERPSPELVLQ